MILKLAIKNLLLKPLHSFLSWILLSVAVGIISLVIVIQHKFETQFTDSIRNTDMVIGAKGSPLQLILSAVYHIDAPTGNISLAAAEKWMHHPYVETAIPLAYGDSYKGYRIVGTSPNYVQHYNAQLQEGKLWTKNFEAVIGAFVAEKLQLKTGSRFYSTHGDDRHGEQHEDHPYTVTGVLAATGTVIDNLILSNIEST